PRARWRPCVVCLDCFRLSSSVLNQASLSDTGRLKIPHIDCAFPPRIRDYVNMTIVMKSDKHTVSKSGFKARALEFFRQVEKSRQPVIITDRGKPVLKVVPFSE